METTSQGAPAPAPVAEMAHGGTAPEGVEVRHLNGPHPLPAQPPPQQITTIVAPEDQVEAEKFFSSMGITGWKVLDQTGKENWAKLCDLQGQHAVARALRGKKRTTLGRIMALGERPWKMKHTCIVVGGVLLWGVYELVASQYEWTWRFGIFDQKSSRR